MGKELCSDAAAGLIDVDLNDGLNLVQENNTGCNIYSSSILVETFPSKTIKFSDTYTDPNFYDGKASCAKTTEIQATIRFKETNPKYKVNKNNKDIYTIKLLDSYSSTNPDPNALENICYTKCVNGTLSGCESFRCEPTK